MPFCPNCGKEVATGFAFCPSCGTSLAIRASPNSYVQMPGAVVQPPLAHQPEEAAGLNKVMWFGILNIAGMVIGWILGFYLLRSVFSSVNSLGLGPNPTPAQVSAALGPIFQNIDLILPVILAVQLVSLAALTLGFRDLCKVDRARFSTPSVLMILLVVGAVATGLGGFLFIGNIPTLIAQAPSSSSTAFTSMMGSLAGEFTVLVIGGLLALVGFIGGEVLGLWSVGSRYDETIIKVGAIFTIIPFLNVVAPILVVIGVYKVRGRIIQS